MNAECAILSTNPNEFRLDLVSRPREPKGERTSQEKEKTTEREKVSARIKRNSQSIEKSNGFHSVPSSRTRSFLFSYHRSSLTTGRSSPLHFRRTSRKTFSHKASFLLPAAHRRESLQRTSSGKGGQADDEEPAIIHLYSRSFRSMVGIARRFPKCVIDFSVCGSSFVEVAAVRS